MKHSTIACRLLSSLILAQLATLPCIAQEPENSKPSRGWRRVDEAGDQIAEAAPQPEFGPAPELTIPAGTWITMRVNEPLSSDAMRNGDVFTATLVQPIIVQGFVIARRGQTLGGRVDAVQKAGRFRGTSRLGLELTEISLADGQHLPVRTQLIEYAGGTSIGRDATAIASASGFGAMIGGIVEGGDGAGVGALVGAAASTVGVLVTRGRATVVDPESALTFRTLAPLTISTTAAPHAFQPVRQDDYEPVKRLERRASVQPPSYPPPFYYGPYWPYWSTFYWPSVFVYSRPWGYYGYGGHHHHHGGHGYGRR